jgi:hypothetical protein
MRKLLVSSLFLALLAVSGDVWCSNCHAVDCTFDTQCGVRCTCVKLGGRLRGQCAERW